MDVTTLLGGINIAVTLGAGLLLWWGLSAKFDEVEHFLAARYGDLPDRADRIKDRVAAERAAVSRRIEHLNVYLSHRHDDQTARLRRLTTQVDGLTTRVDRLATTVPRIEGRLERDRMERLIPRSASQRTYLGIYQASRPTGGPQSVSRTW